MNQTTNFFAGSVASYTMLNIMPTSSGIDRAIEILLSGAMALFTQYMLMKWQQGKATRKNKKEKEEQ